MESGGLAIGVVSLAGLFNNAVQCFEYVQIGRAFGTDFETSQLKLDNTRLCLSRWGEAVQIHSNNTFAAREVHQAERNIEQILALFADAEGIAQKFREKAGSSTEVAVYNPDVDMDARALALHEQMRSLAVARQGKGKKGAVGLARKTKWALYEKGRFKELIEDVTDLVDGLEKILPVERETQDRLCREEAATMSADADLPFLEEVAAEQDPALVEAVRRVMGEKEERLPSVVFSGSDNRGFQLGNNTGTISGFTFGGGDR